MLNKIIVMGRLTRDPELRRTQSGTATANFSIACERDIPNRQTGQRETDFIDVVCWGATAENVGKFLSKGDMAVPSGRLQLRSWTDKSGNKRISAEINADFVYFYGQKHTQRASEQSAEYPVMEGTDEECPF